MLKSWKAHFISRCWNADNSSGKDLFLGWLRIVFCVGNEDVCLNFFMNKRSIQDSLTTVVYIFHLAVNISLQNIIDTALNVYLLVNLLYWQSETTAYVTPHFLEENKLCTWFLFITSRARSRLRSCKFINHSLKHKVVIFAEFLKH